MQKNNESWEKKNWVSQVAISCDKTTQNRNESIETVPQFNGNLMIQYNEGKGYKGYRTINIFEFKNTKSDIKVLQLLNKKKSTCQANHIYQLGKFTYKS